MTQHRVLATAAMAFGLVGPVALQAQQSAAPSPDTTGPSAIAYKGVTLTPIGFFAAEGVWRQRTENADIGSSFNAIPFPNTTNGQESEFRMSARQSRLGLLAEGKLNDTKLSGYWESDFLSSGTSSNSNESNSYTFRMRQFWGQAAFNNGVTVSAGQMWSFLTTERAGVSPRAEAAPLTIDAQYVVGFDWARQAALRITDKLGDKAWIGLSAEEPQTLVTAHNGKADYISSATGGNLLNNTTTYSYNIAPDVIGKLVFEPGFGHYELKFLGRVMTDRMYSPTGVVGGGYDSVGHTSNVLAGGVGVAGQWKFSNKVDFGISGLWGHGIGRYGTSGLPDATVDSTGKLIPILAAHGLASLEFHASPKLDLYLYGGAEYEGRTAGTLSTTTGIGYGSPLFSNAGCNIETPPSGANAIGSTGSCTADTRAVYQGAVGTWYRFYKGPAGAMQWGLQYSYTGREAWVGVGGGPNGYPKATDGMVFTSIRYYIP
ncbi:MAG TPA: hypothetical protein VNU46_05665 [Gemmatimonadaceae bacterium]|nr:hypothetical protein [Gemmatimonadaceae bacterium]